MRVLLLAALALAALPALAQPAVRQERRIVVTVDSLDDGQVTVRRFEGGPDAGPGGERVVVRRLGRGGEADTVRFRFPGADVLLDRLPGMIEGPFREAFPTPGVSDETRDRMRTLDERSRVLAREARAAEGRDRDRLERELDGVLAELFDVRAEARREEAAHLRERADALDAGLRTRSDRREELLDARRRELLGETDGADW